MGRPGQGTENHRRLFRDHLSDHQKERIRWACCDLSETFIGAIGQHCPNAELVLDRFHVVKALNEAVDEVRKHAAGITAFIGTHLTNAAAEGLNRVVRRVKNRASGFKSLEAFADLIYLCVGDLDIAAQIPARFRTV